MFINDIWQLESNVHLGFRFIQYFYIIIGHSTALEIKNCSSGERNVIEYTTVRVACGKCKESMAWYVDDDKDKKYVGDCNKINCAVQDKSAFNLNTNKATNKLYSTLIISNISRMDTIVVRCKCIGSSYDDKGSASCKLIIKGGLMMMNMWWLI